MKQARKTSRQMMIDADPALAAFASDHPESRACGWITRYGSGGTRRLYTCVACRVIVATESAQYPQTRHAAEAVAAHEDECDRIDTYRAMGAAKTGGGR